ncbi:MAG: hypothetical protein FJ087_01510 [Deltaproteobacteria bacterium]|nr:hypothetical protein [Deltaproteobacteria bacterium]
MANLPEEEGWEPGVYQIEDGDEASGGADGIANVQARQLASRTAFLRRRLVIVRGQTGFGADGSVRVTHGIDGEAYSRTAYITPLADTEGGLGEVWYEWDGADVVIHHTGEWAGPFEWVVVGRLLESW